MAHFGNKPGIFVVSKTEHSLFRAQGSDSWNISCIFNTGKGEGKPDLNVVNFVKKKNYKKILSLRMTASGTETHCVYARPHFAERQASWGQQGRGLS